MGGGSGVGLGCGGRVKTGTAVGGANVGIGGAVEAKGFTVGTDVDSTVGMGVGVAKMTGIGSVGRGVGVRNGIKVGVGVGSVCAPHPTETPRIRANAATRHARAIQLPFLTGTLDVIGRRSFSRSCAQ